MKEKLRLIICITILILIPLLLFSQNGDYPSENEWFNLAIEQSGKSVPIKNNRVELDKSSFTLVLIMREPMGLLVNVSESDSLFKGFIKNKQLEKIVAQPDLFMGIGEGIGNADEMVLIDKFAPHFMYYTDGASHRFSDIELREGYVIGRRVISNYTTYSRDFQPVSITDLAANEIYISIMYSEWDEDYNRMELQKEALKIIFSD